MSLSDIKEDSLTELLKGVIEEKDTKEVLAKLRVVKKLMNYQEEEIRLESHKRTQDCYRAYLNHKNTKGQITCFADSIVNFNFPISENELLSINIITEDQLMSGMTLEDICTTVKDVKYFDYAIYDSDGYKIEIN